MTPTISVVIPAYNAAAFLADAIESVLWQTRPPDQIVIVDDGSTDDTADIAMRYVHDPRVTVALKPNGGISSARNAGIAQATGDYLALLDADDRWHPQYLADQAAVLDADPGLVCVIANFSRFDDATGQILGDQFQYYPELLSLPSTPGPCGAQILTGDPFPSLVSFSEVPCYMQATVFRTALLHGLLFDETLHLGEDYHFALRAYLRGSVAVNPQPLADVRRHATNTTRDYLWFPVYKLAAFQALRDVVTKPAHQAAFRDRLVKAHIDAACVLTRRRCYARAVRTFAQGCAVAGSPLRKLKGAARVVLTAAHVA